MVLCVSLHSYKSTTNKPSPLWSDGETLQLHTIRNLNYYIHCYLLFSTVAGLSPCFWTTTHLLWNGHTRVKHVKQKQRVKQGFAKCLLLLITGICALEV